MSEQDKVEQIKEIEKALLEAEEEARNDPTCLGHQTVMDCVRRANRQGTLMEAKHEDAERSASFVCSMPPPFFPAGAFQGDARRMSRVAASTEFGLPNSLVRGKPLIPLPQLHALLIRI